MARDDDWRTEVIARHHARMAELLEMDPPLSEDEFVARMEAEFGPLEKELMRQVFQEDEQRSREYDERLGDDA